MPFIALALVIAAAVGGGTALAAENALPGDPLWSVKVGVDERLAGMLATDDQAQAQWDLAAIQTRLGEAQQLSSKGALTAQTEADLADNLNVHVDDLSARVATLQRTGQAQAAATLAADFQASMAHSAAALGTASATQNTFLTDVHTTLDEASSLSADAQAAAAASSTK